MVRAFLFLLFPLLATAQTETVPFPGHLTIDSSGKATICVQRDFTGTVYVQEFRWNRWCVIDSVERKSRRDDTCYSRNEPVNYSPAQFRLKSKGYHGSAVVKVNKDIPDSCSHIVNSCRSAITFYCEQDWEIYDQSGKIVMKGHSGSIDISGLAKGGYFINYANTTVEFFRH